MRWVRKYNNRLQRQVGREKETGIENGMQRRSSVFLKMQVNIYYGLK